MLCPEVWKFPPPESNYKESTGRFESCVKNIPPPLRDFHYTHSVSIVLPNEQTVPETIRETLSSDCDYYKIENISLAELIGKEFIEKFIKKGSLTALSINTKIDIDDCFCLTPEGILILSLDKKTYQELGLEGKLSHFSTKSQDRYIVQLNLKHDTFTTNKKLYERTRQCLTDRLQLFTLILSWEPPEENICPSSVAKYFSDQSYKVFLCTPKCNKRSKNNVKVPQISEDDCFSGSDLVEWLGMFSLDCDLDSGSFDAYLNTYECPENSILVKNIQYLEWRGFFTTHQIKRLYQKLTSFATSTNSSGPWISMFVQGFSDSPAAWGSQEHHYFTNGDNSFVIFLQPSLNEPLTQARIFSPDSTSYKRKWSVVRNPLLGPLK